LSGAVLYLFVVFILSVVALSMTLSALHSIDGEALSGPLVALVLMLGVLYWTTTLLPGPIKRLGAKAGRALWGSMRKKKGRHD